jgi:hypothetical protein
VDVATEARTDDRHDLTITYDLVNRAPGTRPAYVVGPHVEGLAARDHAGLVVDNLPAGSTDVRMTGAEVFLQGGDGPTVVVGGRVTVRRGGRATVTVRATLPAGLDRLVLEPSARIDPTAWTVDGVRFARDRRRTVRLDPG